MNPEELPDDTSLSLVRMVLDGALESDIYKAHELRYEELSQEKKPEILEWELREIINNINQNTFRKLQKKYAGDIQKLQNLLIKAKQHRLI